LVSSIQLQALHIQTLEHAAALDLGARSFQHGAALIHDQVAIGDALGEGEILLDDDESRASGPRR